MANLVKEWCVKHPIAVGQLLGLLCMPPAVYAGLQIDPAKDDAELAALKLAGVAIVPMVAFIAGSLGTYGYRAFAWDSNRRSHTRWSDYGLVRQIKKEVRNMASPEVCFTGKERVEYTLAAGVHRQFETGNPYDR